MSNKCYLNGKFLDLAEAKISVLDRGFLFGDGVYEVIPVYNRRPYFLERHIKRLQLSLNSINLDFTAETLIQTIFHCINNCSSNTQMVYIQVTRGYEPSRQHCPAAISKPTVFILSRPFTPLAIEPIACKSDIDFRWQRGDIKSTSLLAAVMLADGANKDKVDEIMLFRNGNLTEGYKSNYVVVINEQLLTPIKDNTFLHGISCEVLLELATKNGLDCRQTALSYDDVKNADEIFICSTTKGVFPVTSVDNSPIGSGAPGHLFYVVNDIWHAYIEQLANVKTHDE